MRSKNWHRIERAFYHSKGVAAVLLIPGLLLANALDAGERWARLSKWASKARESKPMKPDKDWTIAERVE